MSFKEDAQDEVFVFCDDGEFAELVTIDGMTVSAVVEDSEASYNGSAGGGFVDASGLGLTVASKKLFFPDTLPITPIPDQQVVIGKEAWIVQSVQQETGLLVVSVTAAGS